MEGKLIIICAPSGSGKSTIIGRIIDDERLRLAFSVSATTRPRRGEEIHGVDYYYMSEEDFKQHIVNNDFAEYQEVPASANAKIIEDAKKRKAELDARK